MTLFAADVFEALQTQKSVVSYIFGHTGDAKEPLGAGFPKLLLARIIESAPELSIDCPELLNPRRLRRLTTWAKVWDMLDNVLAHLKCLFLIVDRIDAIEDPGNGVLLEDIATELLALGARHHQKLKILITSINEPPKCIKDSRSMWWIFLSTKKSLGEVRGLYRA